jgi:hypothetical protein
LYAAALDHIYREAAGPITLPSLGVNSVEVLARECVEQQALLRWSAADWDRYDDEWLPENLTRYWQEALTAAACSLPRTWWSALSWCRTPVSGTTLLPHDRWVTLVELTMSDVDDPQAARFRDAGCGGHARSPRPLWSVASANDCARQRYPVR